MKTENLVKIFRKYWWIIVVIAAGVFIYSAGIPAGRKVLKAYKEQSKLIEDKAEAEQRKEELKILLETREKKYQDLQKLTDEYKKKLDENNKKLGRKIPTIRFLPPSDRDVIWSDFERFIIDSRKDSNK